MPSQLLRVRGCGSECHGPPRQLAVSTWRPWWASREAWTSQPSVRAGPVLTQRVQLPSTAQKGCCGPGSQDGFRIVAFVFVTDCLIPGVRNAVLRCCAVYCVTFTVNVFECCLLLLLAEVSEPTRGAVLAVCVSLPAVNTPHVLETPSVGKVLVRTVTYLAIRMKPVYFSFNSFIHPCMQQIIRHLLYITDSFVFLYEHLCVSEKKRKRISSKRDRTGTFGEGN